MASLKNQTKSLPIQAPPIGQQNESSQEQTQASNQSLSPSLISDFESNTDLQSPNLPTDIMESEILQLSSLMKRIEGRIQTKQTQLKQEDEKYYQYQRQLASERAQVDLKMREAEEKMQEAKALMANAEAQRQAVERDRKELEKEKQKWNEEKAKIAQLVPDDEVFEFDISGQETMKVSKSTLTRIKDSVLEAKFSGRHPLKLDKHGRIFIDRNPKQFEQMITYLRNDRKIYTDTESEKKNLDIELQHWGIIDESDDGQSPAAESDDTSQNDGEQINRELKFLQKLIHRAPLDIFESDDQNISNNVQIMQEWRNKLKPDLVDMYHNNQLPFSEKNFRINQVREFVNISYGDNLEKECLFGRYYGKDDTDDKSYICWGILIEEQQGTVNPGSYFDPIIIPHHNLADLEDSQEPDDQQMQI